MRPQQLFPRRARLLPATAWLLAGVCWQPVHADEDLCRKEAAGGGDGDVKISTERLATRADGLSAFRGNVQVERGGDRLRADRVIHNPRTQRVKARGDVRYSSCGDPDPVWFIAADELTLDGKEGTGVAKNAWLHVADVPVFYLPRYYFSKKRRSGLLTPRIARSGDSGGQFAQPLYLNLAPNHDALITPHYYSRRGAQLNARYRYLYRLDRGRAEAAWLDDGDYDDERYHWDFEHRAEIDDFFSLDARWQRVSDEEYLEDLPAGFDIFSESYLRSHLESNLHWRGFRFRFMAEALQRADDDAAYSDRPYETQPAFSVAANFNPRGSRLHLDLHAEAVRFGHRYDYVRDDAAPDGLNLRRGRRYHGSLAMRWDYRRPGFYFTPALTLNHTHYATRRERTRRRSLPIYSARAGLTFAKDSFAGRYRHTIEPEIFYVNAARRKQDEIPLYDTCESEFLFSRLFDENRFNGIDRIGDADRATLALTSRLLRRADGAETVRASLGRTYHFRDRKVVLGADCRVAAAGAVRRAARSDWAGEFALNVNDRVRLTSSLVWDASDGDTAKYGSTLSFRGGRKRDRIVNLFHRYRDDDYEQAGASFHAPLGKRLSLFASAARDLRNDAALHAFGGLEYRSCCWSVRLAAQRRLKDVNNASGDVGGGGLDYDTFVGIQFSLRGLGDVGDSLGELLERRVPGYDAH